MPTIRPYRDYAPHQILQYFSFNASGSYPALKGQFVKILSGWSTEQNLAELGDVGAHYNNTVSQRYGISPQVGTCVGSGDNAVGLMLYDVRETDENGEKLIFKQEKQVRMQAVLSGQCVPILTKGVVLYSGTNGGRANPGTITAGAPAYLGIDGGVNTSGALANPNVTRVGTFLGPLDSNGYCLLKIDL